MLFMVAKACWVTGSLLVKPTLEELKGILA